MNPPRILIIEDERAIARYYAKAIEEVAGFTVEEIVSPTIALELIQQPEMKCDAVVLDIMMPPPPGLEQSDLRAGLLTGAALGELLIKYHPNVRRFVLTHQRQPQLLNETKARCKPEIIWNKVDVAPLDFAKAFKVAMLNK